MAEINIQRKKNPIWPWVILTLIILVGAMFWYWKYYEDDPVNDNAVPNSTGFRQASSYEGTAFFSSYALGSKVC